jgi:Cu/Zn superoxide dismutase
MSSMPKFHVNAAGNAGKCEATTRCPFGSADDHFDTPEEARASYEAKQTVGTLTKLRSSRRP